jgi:O-methyltransferase
MDLEYLSLPAVSIPDRHAYRGSLTSATFRPWAMPGDALAMYRLVCHKTLLRAECVYYLLRFATHCANLSGEFWECGVYRGGTAECLAVLLANRGVSSGATSAALSGRGSRPDGPAKGHANHDNVGEPGDTMLRLFDTWEGMPTTNDDIDLHKKHDFDDVSWDQIREEFARFPNVSLHRGFIPATFAGLEGARIAFLHCDLDIYQSIVDNLVFCYPRMVTGSVILFDDYGQPTCPGARLAVDQFFADKPEKPIVLQTGQAFVIKMAA